MASAKKTTDHDKIRRWIEDRDGRPATVKGTAEKGEEAGLLRIDFGEPEESLEQIDWDSFFEKFDEQDLEFLYQDDAPKGETSHFFKFVRRE